MSIPTKRNYRATFILDNRGKQETVDQIVDGVKKEIAAIHGDVNFSAPPEGPAQLRERLRLNGSVYRTFVQEV
jgi:small subunit ribosomal protein S6